MHEGGGDRPQYWRLQCAPNSRHTQKAFPLISEYKHTFRNEGDKAHSIQSARLSIQSPYWVPPPPPRPALGSRGRHTRLRGRGWGTLRRWDRPKVKYGVRSPKFDWDPCAQLYSLPLAETPPAATPSRAFGLIYEGAIGHPR